METKESMSGKITHTKKKHVQYPSNHKKNVYFSRYVKEILKKKKK